MSNLLIIIVVQSYQKQPTICDDDVLARALRVLLYISIYDETRARIGRDSSFTWKSCFRQFCLQDLGKCLSVYELYRNNNNNPNPFFEDYLRKMESLGYPTTDCCNLPVLFADAN